MGPKKSLSEADLRKHLLEQIGFLERSATALDNGFIDEAKRLAVTLRVLLHDTAHSQSLLGQLAIKEREFCETSIESPPGNVMAHGGLVWMSLSPGGMEYVAMLDDVPGPKKFLRFEPWCNQAVFIHGDHSQLTRAQIVLVAVNQDGGAHVDSKLDATYADLSRGEFMPWYSSTPSGDILAEGQLYT